MTIMSSPRGDQPQEAVEQIIERIEHSLVGKRSAVELLLAAMLAGGHALLEDVPGVGKTLLAQAVARALDLSFKRVQFTPDLLPSDITGVSVYRPNAGEFEFHPGPIFAELVLADELNRASAKTQSALLEAMEERQVTEGGATYALPRPFTVIATQNPIDYEGTGPLPEAQLDRFMLRLTIGYPDAAAEAIMLARWKARMEETEAVEPVLSKEAFVRLQRLTRAVHVDDSIRLYIVQLVGATRTHAELALGASPRASISLMLLAQARALMNGRSFVLPDDVKLLALPALSHRLLLTTEAHIRGRQAEAVLREIVQRLPAPTGRRASGA